MSLIVRMAYMLIALLWRPRIGVWDESRVTMRVWPNDLDPYLHVNNGRYLTIMDVGRIDSIFRNGMFRAFRARHWYPVVASETIRFRESLAPFARFELRTRLLGWDERSLYYHQTFVHDERVAAVGVARIRILRRGGGPVDAAEVAEATMSGATSPPLPDYIRLWQDAESRFSRGDSADGSTAAIGS